MDWPSPPSGSSAAELELYKAQLGRITAADDAAREREKAWLDESLGLAKESVDRARAGAETVRNAAAGIATLYAGALTVSFSVTDNPLPPRGAIPLVLLAVAVAFATVYVAYQSRVEYVSAPADSSPLAILRSFILWANATVASKRGFLRAAVVTLALAVPALGAPFISFSTEQPATGSVRGWPGLPASDRPSEQIRYRAQIKEAAELRTKQRDTTPKREGRDIAWAIVFFVLWLVAMAAVVAIERARSDPSPDSEANRDKLPTTTLAY